MFFVTCHFYLTNIRKVQAIQPTQPTDEELERLWGELGMRFSVLESDTICVFNSKQISHAFNVNSDELQVDDVLPINDDSFACTDVLTLCKSKAEKLVKEFKI
jgi:hypothetical protein